MKKLLVKVINETLWSKTKKLGLIKELGIDLENCEGCEIFEGKYTKKLYGNDLFLFINKDFELIGCTVGAIYQKQFEEYGRYYIYENFRKNRSGLEEYAALIIRVPVELRTYKYRFNKKYDPSKPYVPSLKIRLRDYKNAKSEAYNDDKIMEIIKKVNAYIMENLRSENLRETFYNVSGKIGAQILVDFSKSVEKYEIKKGYFEDEIKFYERRGLVYNPNGNSWEQKQYREAKSEIIDWYNCIK